MAQLVSARGRQTFVRNPSQFAHSTLYRAQAKARAEQEARKRRALEKAQADAAARAAGQAEAARYVQNQALRTPLGQALAALPPALQAQQKIRQAQADQQAKIIKEKAARLTQLGTAAQNGDRNAIVQLQRSLGLKEDGVLGQSTRHAYEQAWADIEDAQAGYFDAAKSANPMQVRADAGNEATIAKQAAGLRKHIVEVQLQAEINKLEDARTKMREAQGRIYTAAKGEDAIDEQVKVIEDFRAKVADPDQMDNLAVIELSRALVAGQSSAYDEAQKAKGKKKGGGLLGTALKFGLGGIVGGLGLLDPIFNRGSASIAAFQASANQGNGWLVVGQAGLGGLVGVNIPGTDLGIDELTLPKGSAAREAWEKVNTEKERQALVESGDLLSFGQMVTGRVTPQYAAKWGNGPKGSPAPYTLPSFQFEMPFFGKADFTSGVADLLATPAKDPTMLAAPGLGKLANVSEVVGDMAVKRAGRDAVERFGESTVREMGRRFWVESSSTGRSMTSALDDVLSDLSRTGDVRGMTRTIPGLSTETAEKAIAARLATEGGVDAANRAARDVLVTAFEKGEWSPTVKLRKQIVAAATRGNSGLGRTFIKSDKWTRLGEFTRRLANDRISGPQALVMQSDAIQFTSDALATATRAAGRTWRTVWHDFGPSETSVQARFDNVMTYIEDASDSALQNVVERRLSSFFTGAASRELQKSVGIAHYLDAVFAQNGFEAALKEAETLVLIHQGKAGEAAAKQLAVDLARGYVARKNEDIIDLAASNMGVSIPRRGTTEEALREALDKLPAGLSAEIEQRLDNVLSLPGKRQKAGLAKLGGRVEALLTDAAFRDEAARLLDNKSNRVAQAAAAAPVRKGLGVASGIAARVLDVVEAVPPSELIHAPGENHLINVELRTEGIDRLGGAYGLDDAARQQLRIEAANVRTEKDLFKVVEHSVRLYAERHGLEPDALVKTLKARGSLGASKPVRSVTDMGEAINELQTISQLVERAPIPRVDELREALREAILDGATDAGWAQKAHAGMGVVVNRAGNFTIPFLGISIKGGAKGAHQFWKFLIVTNAAAPLVGAIGGFLGADGDLGDRFKAAGIGFGIGLLGGTRYVMRVAGIEERMRAYIAEGMAPDVWVPAWSKTRLRRGMSDPFRRFMSEDFIRAGSYGTSHFANDLVLHVDKDFGVLTRSSPRFVDAWHRVINFQLHPETDMVARLLLAEKAGLLPKNRVDGLLKEFFKTDEGAIWKARFKNGLGGTGRTSEALARYRDFIAKYVPEDIAALRMSGGSDAVAMVVDGVKLAPKQLDRSVTKRFTKMGAGPEFIHGQKSYRIPRKAKDLYRNWQELVGRGVLSGPTTVLNRRPMANYLFQREYDRLAREGVDRAVAQRLADEYAVRRTNSIMFKLEDESRFATKVDFFLPFQQPREELLRVWTKLVAENPTRSFRVVDRVARIFNNGAATGIFEKDEFTGEWRMSVPYSARLGRALFGAPFETPMSINIRDMLFVGQGAFNVGFVPSPGGPFWAVLSRQLANTHPELFEGGDSAISSWLWPYGPNGSLGRKESSRLWMAMTGSAAPWEFATQFEQRDQLAKWHTEVAQELIYQNRLRGGDPEYIPSDKEVGDATKKFMKAWTFFSSVLPASPYPRLTGREKYNQYRNAFTLGGTIPFDLERRNEFLKKYPEFEPYLLTTTEYVGPDDIEHWKQVGEDKATEYTLHYRKHLDFGEFKDQFETARRTNEYYAKFNAAIENPDLIERESELMRLANEYPDVRAESQSDYARNTELAKILTTYPTALKAEAFERWRKTYNVTYGGFQYLKEKVLRENPYNPWKEARFAPEIVADIEKRAGTTDRRKQANAVRYLAPAEQVKYWQWKMASVDYSAEFDDASKVIDEYDYYKSQYYATTKEYGAILYKQKAETNPFRIFIRGEETRINEQTDAAYDNINIITRELDEAYKSKNWSAYNALKKQRDQLYDVVDALRDELWQRYPDMTQAADDMRAVALYQQSGATDEMVARKVQSLMAANTGIEFWPTAEQKRYNLMPDAVKAAYLDDLTTALDMPSGKIDYDVRQYLKEEKGVRKLFWDYLSPFQKSLLEKNIPYETLDNWKYDVEVRDGAESSGSGYTSSYRRYKGGGRGSGSGELAFAFQMFKEYNKRGNMAAPAAYKEYLALPQNPAVRSDFLKKHPEVGQYIKLGPLSNMPPLYRELVINTMVKYGKWEGELRTVSEITDIAWAEEQLQRWTKRPQGAMAPETYDAWVNMPTGVEKAQYLKDHPEVADWIRMGPMANMPEDYQNVVRDIMVRYGEWTTKQDPLSLTLTEFSSVPKEQKNKYLQEHPELEAYFALTRDPEEQRMFDLMSTYNGIPDAGARKFFLASHPDLQQWLVDSRSKRYERFLNQVAMYMGANPELFTEYLNRQEDVLTELLKRYAEPVMIREAPVGLGGEITAEEGRRRKVRRSA